MSTSTLTPIDLIDPTGVRWSKLQLWCKKIYTQAGGVGFTQTGLLTDIQLEDSEGMRFAKLQRWLALIAQQVSSGGGGGGSGAGYDSSITSTSDLAAIVSSVLTPPSIKPWIQTSDLTQQVWILLASTAANDPVNGIVRPSDYNGSTNAKVWFKTG